MKKLIKTNLFVSVFFFVMTLCVFGPLELYATNRAEFWFTFGDMLKIVGIMCALSVVVLGGIGLLLKGNARSFFSALLFAVTLCLYIQGNFLNIDYGILDGKAIDWSAFGRYAVINTVVWVFILAAILFLWAKAKKFFPKFQKLLPAFIVAIQILSLCFLFVSNDVWKKDDNARYLSTENLHSIGQNDNIVVFVLDAFDESYMEELLESKPDGYGGVFQDFTHYTNVAVGGASTNSALPIILTGQQYPGKVSYSEYIDAAFNADDLYTELLRQGYRVNLYTESHFVPSDADPFISNLVTDSYQISSYLGITQKYTSATLYKYMPHLLKQFFWLYSGEFNAYKSGSENSSYDAFAMDDVAFYNTLLSDKLQLTEGKTFSLIHTTGAHPPYNINAAVEYEENVPVLEKCKGQLAIVNEYLQQMKALGVYDSSTVIVMSDHGQVDVARGLMLVKRPYATGFFHNNAPISYFDLHNTFFELLGKETGESIFDIPENAERLRMFYLQHSADGTFYTEEYCIKGNPKNNENVIPTGTVFSPTQTQRTYVLGENLSFGAAGSITPFVTTGLNSVPVGFSWTDGYDVTFHFPLSYVPKHDLSLELSYYTAYLDISNQYLGIFVDNTLLFEEVLTSPVSRTISVDIPKDLAKDKSLSLRLHLPDAKIPQEVFGPGHDPHRLGLALTGLCIKELDFSSATPYTFNETLTFGVDATVTDYVISGVSTHDTMKFAWTDSHDVRFGFLLDAKPTSDLQVTVNTCSVFTEHGPQQVKITANGYPCFDATLTETQDFIFTIPAGAFENNQLYLHMVLPNAQSPFALTGEGDRRLLGLALTGLTISPTDTATLLPPSDASTQTPVNEKLSLSGLLSTPLNALMGLCHNLTGNYVLAILLFTLLTKIILLPVSLWMQRNSIKMVELTPDLNRLKMKFFGDKETIAEETQKLYKEKGYHQFLSMLPMIIQLVLLMGVISAVKVLLGASESPLLQIPSQAGGLTLLMPLGAGLAALALGLAQNHLNPLQREQSSAQQWSTNLFSVAISLFLGFFVGLGVCIYWIASNLFTIVQQMLLNIILPPKKYVDYEDLAATKAELQKLEGLSNGVSKEDKQREKADYKRFFSIANKHLVFYSESSGFYKYFENLIGELLSRSNVTIHYITSDPKDQIFKIAETQPRIRPYYIGEKRLITLFMKMDADIVVMTLSDLNNYHLKRSYVRKDIEYIYTFHYPLSTHMVLNTGALDHYDTVFCVGGFQFDEIRFCEKLHGTREKKLMEFGYPMLENLQKRYDVMSLSQRDCKKILIAPSWQTGNILDTCIDKLLEQLLGKGYQVVVRPHPEYMKRYRPRMDAIVQRYETYTGGDLSFELDFTSSDSIFDSDLVFTDWSGTAFEFSFVTKKPAVFINTPPKIHNSEYSLYPMKPLELTLRSQVGKEFSMEELETLSAGVASLLEQQEQYSQKIRETLESTISNFGESAAIGAKYILSALKDRQKKVAPKN